MIVLGVDPGTLVTGIGIVEGKNGRCRLLGYDLVKNTGNRAMPLRLKSIYDTLCSVIERFHPDEFAIESAFYGKNAQSALKIGHARGVAILSAVNYQIPTSEYSPREVKKAIVGNGAASKEQVQSMVKRLLNLKEIPKPYDVTDALAVALCHYYRLYPQMMTPTGKRTHMFRDWKSFLEAHPHLVSKPK